MAIDVAIPEMGESVLEVILLEWIEADGTYVNRDEPICVLETDKANVDLPAPVSGILHTISQVDDTILVGATIATIDDSATEPERNKSASVEISEEAQDIVQQESVMESVPAKTKLRDSEEIKQLSPAVRRLVEEHDIDVTQIVGTGRGGRIIKQDVIAYIKEQERDAQEKAPSESSEQSISSPLTSKTLESTVSVQAVTESGLLPQKRVVDRAGERREPMSRIRKRIADRLVDAQRTAAILTTFNEVDLSQVMMLRDRHKERFKEKHGVSLGLTSFFSRAAVLALMDFEEINAKIERDEIVYHDYVNLGIAVSSERGLVVPIVKGAHLMSISAIEREIKRLALSARENKLGTDDISGGTFTITNGGVFGSLLSTPILTPPQTGILGMHAIKDRPMAVDKELVVRPMMYLALSYDHRLVDGEQSVKFLIRIKDLLEDPSRLMLEI